MVCHLSRIPTEQNIDLKARLCRADGLRSWLRLAELRKQDVLGADNISFVKKELANCTNSWGCHPLTPTDFVPTRLIDLGDDAARARLVETDCLAPADRAAVAYMALSYCWGPPNEALTQLRTTSDSLDRMRCHIPDASMSQTLRDAARVARTLGIRYLWVEYVPSVRLALSALFFGVK